MHIMSPGYRHCCVSAEVLDAPLSPSFLSLVASFFILSSSAFLTFYPPQCLHNRPSGPRVLSTLPQFTSESYRYRVRRYCCARNIGFLLIRTGLNRGLNLTLICRSAWSGDPHGRGTSVFDPTFRSSGRYGMICNRCLVLTMTR